MLNSIFLIFIGYYSLDILDSIESRSVNSQVKFNTMISYYLTDISCHVNLIAICVPSGKTLPNRLILLTG